MIFAPTFCPCFFSLKKRQASAAGLSEVRPLAFLSFSFSFCSPCACLRDFPLQPTPKKRTTMNSLISEITDPDVSSVKLEAGMLAPESAELAGGDSAAASSSRRAVNGAGVASSMPSTPSFSAAVNGKSRRDDGRAQDSLAPSPSFASASGGSASRDRSRKESSRRARDATDDAPDDFSPRGRRYDDGGYSQDESPDGSPAAERAVFRRDTRRTSSRGRAFHKDMTVADMLKRTRAMLQYLRRSRRDLTQGGRQYDEFEENERSKTPTGSESECLQRIAELEGRVVKFQQSYSSRGRSSESLAASPSPSPTATIAQ